MTWRICTYRLTIGEISIFTGIQRYPKLLTELDQEFRRVVPPELVAGNETVTDEIADAIRAFYFQQQHVDMRHIDNLIDVSSYKLLIDSRFGKLR